MAIIKRSTKGTPLTHAELDGNFDQLVADISGKQATLPSQTGNNGKVLGTNGTTLLWTAIPSGLPSYSNLNNGQLLGISAGSPTWQDPPISLPTQTGNAGKFLTTNGSTSSWATVSGGGGSSVLNVVLSSNIVIDSSYAYAVIYNQSAFDYTITVPMGLPDYFTFYVQQNGTGRIILSFVDTVVSGGPTTTTNIGDSIQVLWANINSYHISAFEKYEYSIPVNTNTILSNGSNNKRLINNTTTNYTLTIPVGLDKDFTTTVIQGSTGTCTINYSVGVTVIGQQLNTVSSGDTILIRWVANNTYIIGIDIPQFIATDAGKVLTINRDGKTVSWLPSPYSSNMRLITASETAVISDNGIIVKCESINNISLIIPPNSSVAFPLFSTITLLRYGTGLVSFTAGSGVTIRDPGISQPNQYGTISIKKIGTNEWIIMKF